MGYLVGVSECANSVHKHFHEEGHSLVASSKAPHIPVVSQCQGVTLPNRYIYNSEVVISEELYTLRLGLDAVGVVMT